ncbi:porin [Phreatobacter stygius]|uniref:porin n=1 Tax=Phreatobacter stygius TaxID=1940610 RepID=UPI001B8B72CF
MRICDTYGAGFSSSRHRHCLRIGGFVRVDYGVNTIRAAALTAAPLSPASRFSAPRTSTRSTAPRCV